MSEAHCQQIQLINLIVLYYSGDGVATYIYWNHDSQNVTPSSIIMTTNTSAPASAAKKPWQWQTRVLLRSSEGDGYEIDRDILVEGR